MEVIERLYGDRYKLILGKREFNARSKKELKRGERYWGDLNMTKEGIISLSNLVKKPSIFDDNIEFFSDKDKIFLLFKKNLFKTKDFFDRIIDRLSADDTQKSEFLSLTHMLLAYKEGVFHLPIVFEKKRVVVQFKKSADKQETIFYIALENLGPISGRMSSDILTINTIFQKSFHALKGVFVDKKIALVDKIEPLFEPNRLLVI